MPPSRSTTEKIAPPPRLLRAGGAIFLHVGSQLPLLASLFSRAIGSILLEKLFKAIVLQGFPVALHFPLGLAR